MEGAEGKPVSQMFADEIDIVLKRFQDSGLENSQAIGVLEMKKFDLMAECREVIVRRDRPF